MGKEKGMSARRRRGAAPGRGAALRAGRGAPSARTGASAVGGWIRPILSSLALFIVIHTFILQTFTITSGSMERTLLVGDFLIMSKAAYGAQIPGTRLRLPGYEAPDRGDVVVFRWAHQPGVDVVKRLVGLPGDTLAMRDGRLYVNGAALPEPYAVRARPDDDPSDPSMLWQHQYLAGSEAVGEYRPTLNDWGPIVVPAGKYFVMGDNRDNSLDSRYWGFVDRSWLRGRALALYFSYDPTVPDPFPWIQDVRWGRIASLIR